ncbi:hypothetical protein LPTSP2_06130 [Leptospira ellinghausenii]|uniref:Uncharacterized protein n=1 Tax=Leptospira ellinghausenii TaxID=1917822 RepID=A0A2P2D9L7_9LEPT|nr:hypothetical protein [Leptospira ellinghausenii]GBF41341.1 hypothetical protein LPTSP2_06130 [Leptospira ellinghausenii]
MPKYESIIFFVETPFTDRDEKRFGIKELSQLGFQVEVYQLEDIFHRQKYIASKQGNHKEYITYFSTIKELENALRIRSKKVLVILLTGYHQNLLKLMVRLGIDYALHCTNKIPSTSETVSESKYIKIKQKLFEEGFSSLSKSIGRALLRSLEAVIRKTPLAPTYVIAGGSRSIEHLTNETLDSTKIIWAHSLDFDLFLQSMETSFKSSPYFDVYGNLIEQKNFNNYIVFLDEYSPYHPDNDFFKIPYADKKETYYPRLESFFHYLEKKYNAKMVIAAHPRSEYQTKEHFKSFIIIKYRTLDLIKNCRFALIHSSTSINFINLFEKEAIFFNTSSMRWVYKKATSVFAKWHGKVPVEVDINTDFGQIDFDKILNTKMNFKDYRNLYIKKVDSKLDYSWNIIAEAIRK